jgi:succinate dehydrogenase / fumarate reductase, cytochrome b subunit
MRKYMANIPHPARRRPLSPFLTVFRWPITMATSITHRATGVGLAGGAAALVWWLFAVSHGQEVYHEFYVTAASLPGQIVLYGFAWALAYHFFNGIRHLAWDFGYGFAKKDADITGLIVIALSLLAVAGIYALIHFGLTGYFGIRQGSEG